MSAKLVPRRTCRFVLTIDYRRVVCKRCLASQIKTMEDASRSSEHESVHMKNFSEDIKKHGLSRIGERFKAELDDWKNVGIKIGVTGNSGVGKSSFINAIRG